MLPKPVADLTYADIEALCASKTPESRTLEFKRELPGESGDDRREFLADVSAMANTAGGDLIFGLDEAGGIATAMWPIITDNPDAQILRMEDILRNGLDPRLPDVSLRWIGAPENGGVIVLRVQRSWAAPHRVIFREHSKFYARTSTGKYPMDVAELRAAFAAAETIPERIRAFRRERIATIEADEAPVLLRGGPKLLFHIIPISAFVAPLSLHLPTDNVFFPPIESQGFNFLHTLEGFATYSGAEDNEDGVRAYTMIFRNGTVEAISAGIARSDVERGNLIFPGSIEGALLEQFNTYFGSLSRLSVEPPFYILLSLIGVRGYSMSLPHWTFPSAARRVQRRQSMLLPEVLVTDARPNRITLLRPIFDLMWQGFGHAVSRSFDAAGNYTGDR